MAGQQSEGVTQRTDMVLVFGEAGDDVEMPVHSLILCLASPVFNAMLSTDMVEKDGRRVRVEAASREDFAEFYRFLLPLCGRSMSLSERNVDSLLTLSDYYQVEPLKEECERFLEALPVSVPRLLQAHRHGLRRQYERCAEAIAQSFHEHDMSVLSRHNDIMLDVVLRSQRSFRNLRQLVTKICALRPEIQKARDSAGQQCAWGGGNNAEDPWARGWDPWAQPGPHPIDALLGLMCEASKVNR
mmetsp:Transcript_135750/g.378244  ORF Transcript_135750/g.378244 Transcript_135750/m.378244 type:complete len:243 (+) Transcript_135750:123-851(+)|eukprot:CAMPEP_0179086048 /NCGR_PEP_ID=MMETSP0796-20121207/39007_1 /TAXON_ID=73915 /ORGANISM="Pyrodinium bahamense, Strain pbaha01" /LENGTH=242 /DNA_ID=CAMNT_0020783503 /DNA_START=34 /DNA_END=762 /DNA_ORIENTATION=+